MNATEIFDRIDRLNEKYLDVWEDVCNIESPSNYKEDWCPCERRKCGNAHTQGRGPVRAP